MILIIADDNLYTKWCDNLNRFCLTIRWRHVRKAHMNIFYNVIAWQNWRCFLVEFSSKYINGSICPMVTEHLQPKAMISAAKGTCAQTKINLFGGQFKIWSPKKYFYSDLHMRTKKGSKNSAKEWKEAK